MQCLGGLRRTIQLNDVKSLTEDNDNLKSTLETILDQLANPSLRSKIFTIADALIGGNPVAVSSGCSTCDLPWDGRRPGKEDEVYRRRCLMFAIGAVKKQNEKKSYRRR